jgi:general secretion pathway protein D
MLSVWILLSLSLPPAGMGDDGTEASSAGSTASNAQGHTILNMVDTDITVLIETISAMTGKTFIIDGNVKGKVNVVSPEKISPEEAYRLFESVLEVNGFALVPAGKAIKVVPVAEARTKSIETRVKSQELSDTKDPEDKLITQLIHLKYADVKEVKTLFTPLVSKNSVIQPYADTNTLIVADVESNIKRLLHIISAIDVPGIGREVSFIPLAYADADTVSKTLASVFKTSMSTEKDVAQKTLQFVSDQRTNAVIFVASEDDTSRIKKLIALLDRETTRGNGRAHVYSLMHHDAVELVKVLQEIPKGDTTGADNGKSAAVVSDDVSITADEPTNSLIIFADNADYSIIKDIIEQLDTPRSMVYIEAMIMEVSVGKDFELGVEWSVFNDTTIDGDDAIVGGGFNTSNGFAPTDLLTSSGMSMGVVSGSVDLTISGTTYTIPSLGALIKALESDEDVHILSTPKLLTTDNTEASIVVGKKIPYQTRTSTSDNETYNSYDYQNVGLTLDITPHISEDRNVRLKIAMELSALTGASTEISTTPTTLNRTVETTVIVEDQNMLVIGGLIDDNSTTNVTKVPLLGSIPILGRLFRYDSQIGSKTNLYMFITPRVVKNPSEAVRLTNDVQETLNPVESGMIKLYGPIGGSRNSLEPYTTEPAE